MIAGYDVIVYSLADLEGAQGPGFGMWLLRQDDLLHVVPLFDPKNVPSLLSKFFAAR